MDFLKKNVIALSIATIIGIAIIWAIGSYISYNNKEVSIRTEAEAQVKKIEGVHDKMWKIISQKAQISQDYKESFDTIYTHIMSGRYQSNGTDGSLMKWITEANPQFDTALYKDLANSIEVYRNEFATYQERMIDLIREHETLERTIPSKFFISDTRPIEYTVISSSKSKMVMETGLDEDTDLFKK